MTRTALAGSRWAVLSSLRNRLLALFLVLVVVVGAATMSLIERALAGDLLAALDERLSTQAHAVADEIGGATDVKQLAAVTGTHIAIVGSDGRVQADSLDPSAIGRPAGDAAAEERQHVVAVPDHAGRTIRLAVPIDDVIAARTRMRDRLVVGFGLGFLGALLLAWIFVRAITRPIRSVTRTAERLAAGEWDAAPPELATAAGGELAVLAGALMHMAGEVKARIARIRALEAARAELLSNAAHELRTPVTAISGYSETLLGGAVDAETAKEFLSTIHRNAQRIASLVADLVLLDQLAGRDTAVIARVAVPIADVAGDAARTVKGIAPAARIEIDVPAGLAALATREGLDHVVQNLVDNAVKYGGGTPVAIRAERIDARVRLSVADSGPGIPKGSEERVFERFYRVDAGRSRAQGGTGLGLAIVKSQVEAMGGRVWIEHAEPGARFVIELDAA